MCEHVCTCFCKRVCACGVFVGVDMRACVYLFMLAHLSLWCLMCKLFVCLSVRVCLCICLALCV